MWVYKCICMYMYLCTHIYIYILKRAYVYAHKYFCRKSMWPMLSIHNYICIKYTFCINNFSACVAWTFTLSFILNA